MNRRAFLSGLLASTATLPVLAAGVPTPCNTLSWEWDPANTSVWRVSWQTVSEMFIPGGRTAHRITHDEHAAMMGNLFAGMAEMPHDFA